MGKKKETVGEFLRFRNRLTDNDIATGFLSRRYLFLVAFIIGESSYAMNTD